ncbi:hypothetical protein R5H30_06430 [Sulfitobacter sp. D35]|uniref:hypothetical protein n=1 Tax=Sulfitobacter sp. D35 TaxID=3083252 RepID=UPI00296E54C6|nr:hypothetical protein [Sulfitobacter sp. D35]MDW4497611.1 hypothetical protein [Sulfitobacter sp. D35]
MAQTKPIFLHLGAHRTGSSSFQACLALNRDALAAAGFDIAYPGRDGIPGGRLRLRLPAPRHGRERDDGFAKGIAETFANISPDPSRGLILSEENIPGAMRQFRKGRFYPAAEGRLELLSRGMPARPDSVLLVVRRYDALFRSSYRKRAEDNAVPDFATLVPAYLSMDRGWPEIVAAIRDILRPDRLVVVNYPERGTSLDLLHRLVPGLAISGLREPERPMNLSATDQALKVLQARYRIGETLGRSQWKAIIAENAGRTEDHGFAVFSEADSRKLRARHDRDLDRLAAMPGVTLVSG